MNAIDSSRKLRIFFVEDEVDFREEVTFGLIAQGFDVTGFSQAPELYRALAVDECDIVIIDVGLSGEDGFSICEHLRSKDSAGIVFLSSRSQLVDRLRGMGLGADAYLVKPIDIRELAATLQAIGRRVRGKINAVSVGTDIDVDGVGWHLRRDGWGLCNPAGRELLLTNAERRLLKIMFALAGQVVSHEALIAEFADSDEGYDPHRLDAVISRLRKRTDMAGLGELPLRSVRGAGYVFAI